MHGVPPCLLPDEPSPTRSDGCAARHPASTVPLLPAAFRRHLLPASSGFSADGLAVDPRGTDCADPEQPVPMRAKCPRSLVLLRGLPGRARMDQSLRRGEHMPKSMRKARYAAGACALLLIGAGSVGAKVEGDTVVLGAAVSLTGKYSVNGKNTKDGYDLAVKRINEMGGGKVDGNAYELEVLYYDDESTPARGAQLAQRLISQDGVKFVLGAYSSGLTKAIAPVTEKYKVPHVEGNGAARELFTQGYRYLFAVLSTSDYYLRDAVNLAAEVAKKNGR